MDGKSILKKMFYLLLIHFDKYSLIFDSFRIFF